MYILQVYQKIILAAICLLAYSGASAQENSRPDLRLNTVVIDPGHGGKDPGSVSKDRKTQEKTLTLKISKLMTERIREAYPQMNVILTRSSDEFLELSTRARKATGSGAQFFISVHINAAVSTTASGYSVYILGPSKKYDSYEVNLETLRKENSVIYLEDDTTTYKDFDSSSPESAIFLQLMQNAFREQSLEFAEIVSSHLEDGPFNKNWGVMQDNFHVLRQASMPAVLLELGFISNPSDLAVLRSDEKISEIVDRLVDAFKEYKTIYDQSVMLIQEDIPEPEVKPAPAATPEEEAKTDRILYGTQILVSGRSMKKNDKYFRGYEVIQIPYGGLFKYIIGVSEKKDKAEKNYSEIKKKFPDSFMVKIEGETVTRE